MNRLFAVCLILAAISGCIEKEVIIEKNVTVYAENTTRIEALQGQLAICEAKTCPECPVCPEQNCTQPSPCSINTTKYSFGCGDIYAGYFFQTKYLCYWDVRERYKTGVYTNMAELCFALGLPDACACYWTIKEYTGIRASTGAYPGGWEYGSTKRAD